jgi:hypothetical protein
MKAVSSLAGVACSNILDNDVLGWSGSVDGWGAMLQAERSRFRIPMMSLNFFFFQVI